jgi:hypothetical protein
MLPEVGELRTSGDPAGRTEGDPSATFVRERVVRVRATTRLVLARISTAARLSPGRFGCTIQKWKSEMLSRKTHTAPAKW